MTRLPEDLVHDLLNQNGMIGGFVDYQGNNQDAPVIQMFEFREEALSDDDRCIFIRVTGDSSISPHLIRTNQIVLGFVSKKDDADMAVSRFRAEELYDFFINNFSICQMHGIVPSTPGTPIILKSGRRVFELNLETTIGRRSA